LSSTDPCFDVQDRFDDGQITAELYNNCLSPLGPGGGVGPNLLGAGIDATIITSGGLGRLKPEESEAYTLGMVLTPTGSNLSIAIDYFDIRVNDEVTRPSGAAIAYLCYTSDVFPADPFCDLITRTGPAGDDANNIDTITADYINIADQRNRGVDVTVRYTHDIGRGALTATAQATYQIQDTTKLLDELPVTDTNGNVGEPKFTGNTEVRYDWDDWTVQWSMQFVGPSNDNDYCIRTNDCFGSQGSPLSAFAPYEAVVSTDWVTYHDLSVRKRHDDWTFLAGVSNIFDTPPPRLTDQGFSAGNYVNIPGTGGFGLSQYDLLGRRLFVNVSKSF
jgi:iron complex outermembrane receptor protein